MYLDDLIAAIDRYVEAKESLKADSAAACYDWDCGIANEMSGSFATAGHRERMEQAKDELRVALDRYIDSRVECALKKGCPEA